MAYFIQQTINGLTLGAIYGLVALGPLEQGRDVEDRVVDPRVQVAELGEPLRHGRDREVARLGVVGYYGLSTPQVEPFNTHQAFYKCARLQFSVAAQSEPGLLSFREAIRRIDAGEVRVDYCVGPTYELADIAEAIQCAFEQGRGDVKITIKLAG